MVWCGEVWCGVVWCGVVWCGEVWCIVKWSGMERCGVEWRLDVKIHDGSKHLSYSMSVMVTAHKPVTNNRLTRNAGI